MRILFLAPAPPLPRLGGGSVRMAYLLRHLGARFQVDLLAPYHPDAEEAQRLLASACDQIAFIGDSKEAAAAVSGWSRRLRLGPYPVLPSLRRAVHQALSAGTYDAIHVEKASMLPYLPARPPAPVVLDLWSDGILGGIRAMRHERRIGRRLRVFFQTLRIATYDALCWPPTHAVLVVSAVDSNRLQRLRPGRRYLIVPNGVDCSRFQTAPSPDPRRPILTLSGDMGFAPNVDAVLTLVQDILPRLRTEVPEIRLRVVGRNPAAEVLASSGPEVEVTGEVPDFAPYLAETSVYVAPFRTGAGTRLKILEAMAAGLPIVTSPVGAEGLEVEPGRHLEVADRPEPFARLVVALLRDRPRAERLGREARTLAEMRYDWRICVAPLVDLYARLAQPLPEFKAG